MNSTKQKILIAAGAVVIIILVVLISLNVRQKLHTQTPVSRNAPIVQNQADTSGANSPSLSVTPQTPVSSDTLAVAKPAATGSSLVTPSNIAVTPQGKPVKLNVTPASSQAPTESAPISSGNQIKATGQVINISASSSGFLPQTFTVKAGGLVNFTLTSTDNYSHIFMFDSPSLNGATLGVAAHETKEKSWNAPQAGSYTFTVNLLGYAGQGQKGTMVVTP